MKSRLLFALIFLVQVSICTGQGTSSEFIPYSPSDKARMVAEWEPAIGVLIAWPLSIPHRLVIQLAEDIKLQVLVENQKSKQEAIKWFSKWGILPDRVRFITAPQGIDVSWTRDWGPHAVYTPQGDLFMADPKYLYATPTTGLACDDSLEFIYKDANNQIILTKTDDRLPEYVANSNDVGIVSLPFAFTGGNVISDGQRTAFSTCALLNENRYTGVTDEKFYNDARRILGIQQYNVISNFEEHGIQHIDCFMKMLDEETLLVLRPPSDHPSSAQYEGIVNQELKKLTNTWGRPYKILRIDTDTYEGDHLAAYTNALILNKKIYVPMYGIPQDSVALEQWRAAMPGYSVKGYEFVLKGEPILRDQVKELYTDIGWTGGDALHCRTRAIWDPNMIYISVNRIAEKKSKASSYPLDVILKDYSKGSLQPESLKVIWRVKGKEEWKEMKLTPGDIPDHYKAAFPGGQVGVTIEYYVTAKSNWGTAVSTMPRTAPEGYYSFSVE